MDVSKCNVSSIDLGIFYWKENNYLIGILGNDNLKSDIIHKLKNTFMFGSKEIVAFTYLAMQLTRNTDFSFRIN